MGRPRTSQQQGLNKGAWTAVEDKNLNDYVKSHGKGNWNNVHRLTGLKRCGKSCRMRWMNYLRPDLKRGKISSDEEELIARLHKLLGNRWALIAGRLPGRTDNEIKNYWNTKFAKRAKEQSRAQILNTTAADDDLEPQPQLQNDPPSCDHVEANGIKFESEFNNVLEGSPNFVIDFNVDDIYQILDSEFGDLTTSYQY